MFWKLPILSASSPVEAILDKENFTLEELLDEEEIIQECKALNSRLINFLRERAQVEQLLHYIIDEPPEDSESKRSFKFPFIACEIFICEIDVILKTLVEEEELMDLLFSFLEPERSHSAFLAGYFSKVVVCLMLRKTVPLMNYVQAHQDVFRKLVDLIGITSIMELLILRSLMQVLVRLVGADDHVYPNFTDVMQWLADSNLLEMVVDKLSPSCSPEVHANAAETLSSITRNTGSALAAKLSSSSFVARIFGHALEDSPSKSGLIHSLSVCISLLDPKRLTNSSLLMHSFRSQHMYEAPVPINPETIDAMLPQLGDLLKLLNVSSDEKVLPTTYGQLKPPLGKHRLKIVEFIAILLKTGNEAAEKELVSSGTIGRVLDLFFEYPYNNALHHHVESIIFSCLESKSESVIDHLLREFGLIGRLLQTDKKPVISDEQDQPTLPAAGKRAPRLGNLGHITRICNKLVHLGNSNSYIHTYLQENSEWNDWQTSVLQERNIVENVYRWACGRPTALHDRTRDSDDEDLHDRDYDVAALANNLNQAFRYKIYGNEDTEEQENGGLDRDDEDVYFDDESAEVVISSLRLGDDQGSNLFTNSNWFVFQDDRIGGAPVSTSAMDVLDDVNLNGNANGGGNSSSDDEVVVGEDDELTETKDPVDGTSTSTANDLNGLSGTDPTPQLDNPDVSLSKLETPENPDFFGATSVPEWVAWGDEEPSSADLQTGPSSLNPFLDPETPDPTTQAEAAAAAAAAAPSLPNGSSPTRLSSTSTDSGSSQNSETSQRASASAAVPSLFEEDVEFVGVEPEGTEKAMDQALKEGIVGEAGPLKRNIAPPKLAEKEKNQPEDMKEFNDANYWKVDQEVTVLE
ncbi:Serine/threonine-protein phosphatase 6 regulatory subunit 3 [Linum perenne]